MKEKKIKIDVKRAIGLYLTKHPGQKMPIARMAELIGVSTPTLHNWMNGVSFIALRPLIELAKISNCTLSSLIIFPDEKD